MSLCGFDSILIRVLLEILPMNQKFRTKRLHCGKTEIQSGEIMVGDVEFSSSKSRLYNKQARLGILSQVPTVQQLKEVYSTRTTPHHLSSP